MLIIIFLVTFFKISTSYSTFRFFTYSQPILLFERRNLLGSLCQSLKKGGENSEKTFQSAMLFTKFFMVNNLSLLYSFKLEVVPTSNNVNLTLLSYVSYVIVLLTAVLCNMQNKVWHHLSTLI